MPTAWLPCPGNTNATVIGRTRLHHLCVRLDTSAALAVKLDAKGTLESHAPRLSPCDPTGSSQGNGAQAPGLRSPPRGHFWPSARCLCACPLEAIAYNNRHHPLRLEAEWEAGSHHSGTAGPCPAPGVSALSGPLGLSVRRCCRGPKRGFAPERTVQRKERPTYAALRARIFGAPGYQSDASRSLDEGIRRGHHRRWRTGRQDRV